MRANVSFGGSGAQRAHGEREAAPSGACAYDPVSTECHAGPATAGGSVSRPVNHASASNVACGGAAGAGRVLVDFRRCKR